MAKRYSGDLKINITYDDRNFYRASVSRDGTLLWRGTVKPAPVGFGPGVGYDSPKAYDEVASSALAFAEDEVGGVGDTADFYEGGYLIRRTPHTKTSSHAQRKLRTTLSHTPSHIRGPQPPKKSPAQIKREVDEVLATTSAGKTHDFNPIAWVEKRQAAGACTCGECQVRAKLGARKHD